jgi:hypothetical protein
MDTTLKGCPVVHGPRERIEAAVHPTDAVDPDTTNVNGSRNPHTSATIPLDSEGFATIRAHEALASGQPAPTTRPRPRPRKPASLTSKQRDAVALTVAAMPSDEIAVKLGIHPATLYRWRDADWWAPALVAHKGAQATATDAYERRVRYLLLKHLTAAAEAAEAAGVTMEMADIKAGLNAVQKTGEEKRDTTIRDFIATMPTRLREAVEGWQNGDLEMAGLSLDELAKRGGLR